MTEGWLIHLLSMLEIFFRVFIYFLALVGGKKTLKTYKLSVCVSLPFMFTVRANSPTPLGLAQGRHIL